MTAGAVHRGELASGNSGELELKQSQFSPVHSKRSLSADTVKRLLSAAQLDDGVSSARVVSAGDVRSKHITQGLVPQESGGGKKGRKGTGSTDRSPRESRKSSAGLPYWKAEVSPLLQKLESTPYQDIGHLCECCSSLWACLERRDLFGRTGGEGGTKKRGVVLRTVFKLLDHKEPRLLLKVARIIIAVSYN